MKQYRRILTIAGVLVLCLFIGFGYFRSHDNKEKHWFEEESAISYEREQKRFADFTKDVFIQEVQQNTLHLHCILAAPEQMGIETTVVSLGEENFGDETENLRKIREYLQTLSGFSVQQLRKEQQLTYTLLKNTWEHLLDYESYTLYPQYLASKSGIQSYLPVMLANYEFYDEKDIQEYFALLKLIPDYFQGIISFSEKQAAAGLFLTDEELKQTISACRQFLEGQEQHYLMDAFAQRVTKAKFLSEMCREQYQETHCQILKDEVFPAYENLIHALEGMQGSGAKRELLGTTEEGKAYYRLLVRDAVGTGKSVEEIKAWIQEQYQTDYMEIVKLSFTNPEAINQLGNCPVDAGNPSVVLTLLEQKIQEDFPVAPESEYEIYYVPQSMEQHTNPAYYILPPLDLPNQNHIYINRRYSMGDLEDLATLAHEGYPGHLYQTTYFYHTNPDPVRCLLSYPGYAEGWGTYAELYSYQFIGLEPSIARLNQLNKCCSLAIYCLTDIGIHYEGWSRGRVSEYLMGLGISGEAADEIYDTLLENPANYLSYYVGYLEIKELREKAKNIWGDGFSQKRFHQFILETGPADFDILAACLES